MLVNDDPIVEVVQGAVVSPMGRVSDGSGKDIGLTGCVYSSAGRKIALSERASGYFGDHYRNKNPDNIDVCATDGEFLDGHGIYLGHLMGHYGHFITETVSSFWTLLDKRDYDFFLFHPTDETDLDVDYIKYIFGVFKIDPAKVVLANAYYRVATLTVPERLVKLNLSANRRMRTIYRCIAESAGASSEVGRRVYLSRRMNSHSKLGRAILNERFIEHFMRDRGLEIVYPERLPFQEQLRLFQDADLVIGFSGSALHNCVFMSSSARILEFGDVRSRASPHRMQLLCSNISGCDYDFVQWQGWIVNDRHCLGISRLRCLQNAADVIDKSTAKSGSRVDRTVRPIVGWFSSVFDMSLLALLAMLRVLKSDLRRL